MQAQNHLKLMIKTKFHKILFGGVVALSFVSFIYLNTVSIEQPTQPHTLIIQDQYEEEEEKPAAVSLPDVEMVKKIIESGKKVIQVF